MNGHDEPNTPTGSASSPNGINPPPSVAPAANVGGASPLLASDSTKTNTLSADASTISTSSTLSAGMGGTSSSAATTPIASSVLTSPAPTGASTRTPLVSSDIKLGGSTKHSKMPLILAIIIAAVVLTVVLVAIISGTRPKLASAAQSFNHYAGLLTTGDTQKANLDADNWYLFTLERANLTNAEVEEYVNNLKESYNDVYQKIEASKISNHSEIKAQTVSYRNLLQLTTWYVAYPQLVDRLLRVYLESGTEATQEHISEITSAEFADDSLSDLQLLLNNALNIELRLLEAYNVTNCIADGAIDHVCFSDANQESGAYNELLSDYESTDLAMSESMPFVESTLRSETQNLAKALGGENE